jgi:hypothetical protein
MGAHRTRGGDCDYTLTPLLLGILFSSVGLGRKDVGSRPPLGGVGGSDRDRMLFRVRARLVFSYRRNSCRISFDIRDMVPLVPPPRAAVACDCQATAVNEQIEGRAKGALRSPLPARPRGPNATGRDARLDQHHRSGPTKISARFVSHRAGCLLPAYSCRLDTVN